MDEQAEYGSLYPKILDEQLFVGGVRRFRLLRAQMREGSHKEAALLGSLLPYEFVSIEVRSADDRRCIRVPISSCQPNQVVGPWVGRCGCTVWLWPPSEKRMQSRSDFPANRVVTGLKWSSMMRMLVKYATRNKRLPDEVPPLCHMLRSFGWAFLGEALLRLVLSAETLSRMKAGTD